MIHIPEPKEVLDDLLEFLPVVCSALDYGVFQAREFFEAEGREIDRFLAPNLMRYHAKQLLLRHGHEAEDDNEMDVENVPNNGMYVTFGRYHIRILKSLRGDLPIPGQSMSRQLFYQQMALFSHVDGGTQENINLLLLWNVDSYYTLGELSLACPKSGKTSRESVTSHWHCKIPEDYLLGRPIPRTARELVEEIYDLPIYQTPKPSAETVK
jgi:hypothetical protein